MTQPLIQQLAARAGFDRPDRIVPGGISTYATAKLLFELCVYLDEQAKAQVLPQAPECFHPVRLTDGACANCGHKWPPVGDGQRTWGFIPPNYRGPATATPSVITESTPSVLDGAPTLDMSVMGGQGRMPVDSGVKKEQLK